MQSESGTSSGQQVIQLKDEEMRGVYDIILVFRSAREGNPDSDVAYNIGLYAFRHTNIFLKIYDADLTDTVGYYQNADGEATLNGVGKEYKFIDHSQAALFVKSYPIGVSVKSTDKSDGGAINDIGTTLAECVNKAVAAKGYDPSAAKLYDHVTGAEVARYELKDVAADPDGLYFLYGGKYYELVFDYFKIRKNYIFYIA